MWVAVVRALYLQALHPRVIRGTLQNAPGITEPVDAWARHLGSAWWPGPADYEHHVMPCQPRRASM